MLFNRLKLNMLLFVLIVLSAISLSWGQTVSDLSQGNNEIDTEEIDHPDLRVKLISAEKSEDGSSYHWRISRDSGCRLLFGWYSNKLKEVLSYAVGGTPQAEKSTIDIKLIIGKEDGFFRLVQEYSEGETQIPVRKEDRIELPEDCVIREDHLIGPTIITNVRNQSLWSGGIIRVHEHGTEGKFSVRFIVRALKDNETSDSFNPPYDPLPVPSDKPFMAKGKVTDQQGRPMYGVTVEAHTGYATLLGGGETVTGSDGSYILRFGPGVTSPGIDGIGIPTQTAVFWARKSGYYEQNLCRHGDFIMGERIEDGWESYYENGRYVLENKPGEVNFVLCPAAIVKGLLVDEKGNPVPDHKIYVEAEETYPATSVFSSSTTDRQGRFIFDDLVTSMPLWFSLAHTQGVDGKKIARWVDLETDRFRFDQAQVYEIKLIYDRKKPNLIIEK